MSILNKVFSAGAGDLIKNVGGVLDNLTTTKEEKLEAERKIKDMIMDIETGGWKEAGDRSLPWEKDANILTND